MQVHTQDSSVQKTGDGARSATPLIVGIGGSAGALQSLLALLESLGDEPGLAMVVVLHLSPDHESHAVEILQRATPMVVQQVRERTKLEGGRIYVIAPGTKLVTDDGHVQPGEASPERPSSVIDLFFRTMGEVHRDNSVGVVLSGTGRDGSLGVMHIKECGGLTIGQALDDCEHADMPRAAQASGGIDLMLSAADIGRRLAELARSPHPLSLDAALENIASAQVAVSLSSRESAEQAFHDILAALRLRTRHDFRHYKRATILRRLERRIQVNGLSSIPAYRDFVRDHPDELGPLLADMLISVTNFFRDPLAFETLQRDVIPPILESIPAGEEARIWIPACASGEEGYSIAIAMQEHAERMRQAPRLQVFASDINEAALNVARLGVYPPNIAADVSESRLLGFFEKEESLYRVRSRIREMIVFARHNVLSDPPFSRLDLICCRNLLIYLDRTAQAAVLNMFAYALKPGGYLFLGNAESIDAASDNFETVSKEHRIYRLALQGSAFARVRLPPQMVDTASVAPLAPANPGFSAPPDKSLASLHERALAAAAPPSVLINAEHDIERVSAGAGRFVAFGEGTPTRNLLSNVPADVRAELRTVLFRAGATGQSVQTVFTRAVADGPGDATGTLALSVHPVRGDAQALHWLVLFDEKYGASANAGAQDGDSDMVAKSLLQRLEEENRSLKSHLQDTLDRSAVSNEELKASNEELQAINEELRSAKEELETSKEELQSVNEELTTVNTELRMKVDEGNRNNDDLRNLMEASDIATIFVDSTMRVKRFTPRASTLFSLIASDLGRPLMDVKSRLRYEEIVADATAAFKQLQPIERSVTTVDDEHFLARILPYRTNQDKIGGAVLTFVDVTALRRAEQRVSQSEDRLRAAIASNKDFAVISTDDAGRILTWNEGAHLIFGYAEADIIGKPIDLLFTDADRARGIPDQERAIARREGRASDERWHLRRDGTTFFCSGVMATVSTARGIGYIKIARDASDYRHREEQHLSDLGTAQQSAALAQTKSDMRDRFLAVMSHELKQPLNLILVNAELLIRTPEAQASAQVRRIGDTIMRAVSAQETIVNDLLDLSRAQTGKLHLRHELTDLRDMVQRLGEAMTIDATRKRIDMRVELPDQALLCACDPVRIEQIIWNLLGNAIKFTPEEGRVTMSLEEDLGFARLQVEDTGIGISPDALPDVFELFNQGDNSDAPGQRRSGLGIGLALVREMVQAHNGRVAATSDGRGQGSAFTVWLPLNAKTSEDIVQRLQPEPLRCSILMVDDDAETLDALATLMRMEGATVATASSGADAFAMLESGNYDVLLSDIGMPGMSGHALMRKSQTLRPPKRFRSIALTGFGSDVDERDALEAGFDAFLTKPISVERLRKTLIELLQG